MNRRQFLTSTALALLPATIGVGEELKLVDDWELSENQYAATDRARFPVAEQPYYSYLSTATATPEASKALGEVLRVIVPSLCNRTSLKEQLPVAVTDTLYRINLFNLGWFPFWSKIIQTHYPYYPAYLDRAKYIPLVLRADWFCADIYDEVQTGDSQYQLLYEGKVPKNRDEFFKFWGVVSDAEYTYGMIEGKSGVAVNDPSGKHSVRGIENRPTAKRADIWITRDSEVIAGETDPLEQIGKNPADIQHDASEYIVGMYKVLNGQEGLLQAYFLSEGNRIKKDAYGKVISQQKGNRQAKAPITIVEEKNNIRGREIRNSNSCLYCHTKGLIEPTSDEYRKFIKADTQLFLDPKSKYEVERYQGSDLQKYVTQGQEKYADGIKMCCGLTAPEFHAAYTQAVKDYVGLVSLDQLARELALIYGPGLKPKELQQALAYGSRHNIINVRIAEIAEEGELTRSMVLENFQRFQKVVDLWRSRPVK